MGADLSQVSILTRREIEARIAGPLIKAFMEELGRDRALKVVSRVIRSLARESGEQLARQMGGNTIADFARGLSAWGAGGAYEMQELQLTETRYDFDIKWCRYAEMYKELGLADLGVVLSCARDFDLVQGFNPKMELVRTQTIMEGYEHCDFRITLK
jgi:predicted ArsR family transcriptional regulator